MLQPPEEIATAVIDRTSPPGGSLQRDHDDRFAGAVATLAAVDRAVVVLTDVKGLSARAVANALGIGKAQAQIALLHARRAVRECLVQTDTVERLLASAQA